MSVSVRMIIDLNIQHYRGLLKTETDASKRQSIPDELVGKPLSVLIPERHRNLHAGHMDRFMKDPTPRMMGVGLELRAIRKDGSEFPTEISLSPHRIPDGLVVVAAIRDMDGAKRLQHLLLEELHHRMKNMLATVIAITSQSLRTAQNLEEGRLAVESRLTALGRAHDLLLESKWAGAKLSDVIHDAIEPFDSHDVRRFVVQDTHIEIASEAVLPLTMSLNELCTNAVKYWPAPIEWSGGNVSLVLGAVPA